MAEFRGHNNGRRRILAVIIVGILFATIGIFRDVSASSLGASVTIVVIPNAPSDLSANPVASNQVDLTWTDNSSDETGFLVERSTPDDLHFAAIGSTAANVAEFTDNAAIANTLYFYRVAAMNGNVTSPYSAEASTTTPVAATPPSSGGGGGGGGGGGTGLFAPTTQQANVTISGSAYPLSGVTILKDSAVALKTITGPDGNFSATINNLPGGNYVFSVYATDANGVRSSLFTFPVTLTTGATTQITGVFLAPTINFDKTEVRHGDPLVIFGQSAPGAQVKISVHSADTITVVTTSTKNGSYVYDLDTTPLDNGSHSASARAALGSMISDNSVSASFVVGDQNIARATSTAAQKADINSDGRVNLVDFSILAYWYKRSGFPPAYDLNGDGKIDLIDFSIMAYHWTG